MKKIYNIILTILIIAALIVGTLIIIKYGKNHINEKEIDATIENIENQFSNLQEGEQIESSYKGYQIEGILEIPKIDIKYPILNKTSEDAMKISVTKFWGPQPNEIGNYTIAAHNNKDGTMFGKTKYLKIGDIIKITNLKNVTLEYQVFDIYSIDPDAVSCVESVEEGTREVTLITCTNGHKNRLIVKAREIK